MRRAIVAVVAVGATWFAVHVVRDGNGVQSQANFLTDAGIQPNRDATCPVRLDADFAADAGLSVYQRLKFPVSRRVQSDGGIDIQMPPMPKGARDAIDIVRWDDCALDPSTGPVAALWGTSRPLTLTGVVKPWCRQKADAGLPCLLLDGGTAGDRNVSLCAARANPSTCERASGNTVYLGDNPESL